MRALFVIILLAVLVLPSGHASASPSIDISAEEMQTLHTQAAQGDARAQVNLGLMYENGKSVPQDHAVARQWYEKSAAQGNAEAQYNLGVLYSKGHGVPQDYAKARQWWEQAATQGHASAQYDLGALYANGEGVRRDYAKAQQWYEKAAAQGDALAQNKLGLIYAMGLVDVPQNYAKNLQKARQSWEQAATQGHQEAQSMLGWMYQRGLSVPQDDVRAYMWYSLAMAHSMGNVQKFAADNRDAVARRMTPAQVAEAQRLSQQCQAQNFKGC